jgi:hypothetical protein
VFYLMFSHVFLQVVLIGLNVFGHIGDEFLNNTFHKNQDPINHFQLCPTKLRHPKILPFFICIIIIIIIFMGSSTITKPMI